MAIENLREPVGINRIHSILLADTDYQEFEQKGDLFDKKELLTEVGNFLALSGEFDIEQKLHLTLQSVSLFSDQEQ